MSSYNKSNRFHPSINRIYFDNFDLVEDYNGIKHIRGDLYMYTEDNSKSTCIGYYNPVYQPEKDGPTQYFLRLEEKYRGLYVEQGKYESLFNKNVVPLTDYSCPVGLQELISDLEIITYLYEFMAGIRPQHDFESIGMIGIINGAEEQPMIKVIQIKDKEIRSDKQIIEFVENQVESINLNMGYPVKIFKNVDDFSIIHIPYMGIAHSGVIQATEI